MCHRHKYLGQHSTRITSMGTKFWMIGGNALYLHSTASYVIQITRYRIYSPRVLRFVFSSNVSILKIFLYIGVNASSHTSEF